MSYEDFNPLDEKYKQVSDLPEVQQAAFVDNPEGGFVLRSAMENYDKWAKEAKEANDGRSLWKWILMMDRSSALDFAQAEANGVAQYGEETETFIVETFLNILRQNKDELRELIDEHQIDSIISEDYSGRFPAEIYQKMINSIYLQREQSEIPLVPLHSSRSTKQEEVDQAAEKLLSSEQLGKGVLYVTDFVHSGYSSRSALKGLEKAKQERMKQGLESPDFIAFVTLGNWRDYTLPGKDEEHAREVVEELRSGLDYLRSRKQDDIVKLEISMLEHQLADFEEKIVEHSLPLRGVFKGSETDLHKRFELFSAIHNPTGSKDDKELADGLREHLIAKLGKKLAELYLKETA